MYSKKWDKKGKMNHENFTASVMEGPDPLWFVGPLHTIANIETQKKKFPMTKHLQRIAKCQSMRLWNIESYATKENMLPA
jgi:hypothetical protein